MNEALALILNTISPFAMLFGTLAVKQPPIRVYINSQVDHVVYIETLTGRCTGSIIGKDLFLTAAHCIDEDGLAWAMFDDGSFSELKAVYIGKPGSANDIALLKGDSKEAVPAVLANDTPVPSSCFMFGFAGTKTEMMLPCFLGERLVVTGEDYGIAGIAETRKGDSGGPVFGLDGKLVGVIWGADPENPYDLIIAPVSSVHKALKTLK